MKNFNKENSPNYQHLMSDISNLRSSINNTTDTNELTQLQNRLGELLDIEFIYNNPCLLKQALNDPALF